MGIRNIDMAPMQNPSNFRKICMGNWDGIGDPQVYGVAEFDAEKALQYLETLRQESHIKVTVNHLVGRIMALTLKKYPQLNGVIANGKVYLRKEVSIFFQVGLEDAETELVGICVKQADKKGIAEFASEMNQHVQAVKASKDHPMRKAQRPFHYLPWKMVRHVVKFLNWLQFDWNLNLSWLGIPQDPFGSLMVTAAGSLGVEMAFAPLTHIGRTPCQIAVGKVTKKPAVVNDAVVVRQHLNLCCTFDHRFMDGILGSKMLKMVKELFENVDEHRALIEGKVDIENYNLTPRRPEDK